MTLPKKTHDSSATRNKMLHLEIMPPSILMTWKRKCCSGRSLTRLGSMGSTQGLTRRGPTWDKLNSQTLRWQFKLRNTLKVSLAPTRKSSTKITHWSNLSILYVLETKHPNDPEDPFLILALQRQHHSRLHWRGTNRGLTWEAASSHSGRSATISGGGYAGCRGVFQNLRYFCPRAMYG